MSARRSTALLASAALAFALTACVTRSTETEPDRSVAATAATVPPPVIPTAVVPVPQPAQDVAALEQVEVTGTRVRREQLQGAMPTTPAYGGAPSYKAKHAAMPVQDTERYAPRIDNPIQLAARDPVSTFSVDVDTASYANVRRFLNEGRLPPEDAVRTEELINYFGYDDPAPRDAATPFAVTTELARAPWNADRVLLRIGLKGYAVPPVARPPANLVFLIDVSGSMQSPDKLPLVKSSLGLLARQLGARDRIAMVVYAGASGLVLPPTPGDRQAEIEAALGQLQAGGSTNGGDGIRLAYQVAHQAFVRGGINRVLLATDGDFNVGMVSHEALVDLVERERQSGITLTTLGFGTGNYNDALMEQIADKGNGNHAYVDTLLEARKVLVEQLAGTLQVIAGDVKAQVEFDPSRVAEYRLIGYENRVLAREDFNDDAVDAGDIGSGHSVVALYELTLTGATRPAVDPLRYGAATPPHAAIERIQHHDGELAYLKLRFKRPGQSASELIQQPIRATRIPELAQASTELRFSAAVAAFGQKLRGGERLGAYAWHDIERLARGARGDDPRGERSEFLRLVGLAGSLAGGDAVASRDPAD